MNSIINIFKGKYKTPKTALDPVTVEIGIPSTLCLPTLQKKLTPLIDSKLPKFPLPSPLHQVKYIEQSFQKKIHHKHIHFQT